LQEFIFTYEKSPHFLLILILACGGTASVYAQELSESMMDDDLAVEGDIFNDFNEDLEATQVLEDERFIATVDFFKRCWV
jgi:hypothetical protein